MTPRTAEQFEKIRKAKSEQILMAALELFATHGYHGTSISAIAKHAGISKGLLYNYFESKESILIHLGEDYLEMIEQLMNPDHDEEITSQEMGKFIDSFFQTLSQKKELWKLYFQLAVQPGVRQLIFHKLMENEKFIQQKKLIFKYFKDRFDDPHCEMIFFSSLIRGFSFQIVFSPEIIAQKDIENFINKLKSTLMVEKTAMEN